MNLEIRRGQIITTFGIGSILSTPDNESFMILGNQYWKYDNLMYSKYTVIDDRLRTRLGVRRLVFPPDKIIKSTENGTFPSKDNSITAARFPGWHYCRYCKKMKYLKPFADMQICGRDGCKAPERAHSLVPVRFISVCENDHIDDFPFMEWVHKGQSRENDHILEYDAGNATSLSGIKITCTTCGMTKNMRSALGTDSLKDTIKCKGSRPWLGADDIGEQCDSLPRGAQKGAQNIYFTIPISSIFIPETDKIVDRETQTVISNNFSILKMLYEQNNEDFREMAEVMLSHSIAKEKLEAALDYTIQALVKETDEEPLNDDEEGYRRTEYDVLSNISSSSDIDFKSKIIDIKNYHPKIQPFFQSITLVEKLRETRAFAGFSRLNPYSRKSPLSKKIRQLNKDADWLPADVVGGEGIFFRFNYDAILAWQKVISVESRFDVLKSNFELNFSDVFLEERLTSSYVLLHTFSHILINELARVCGYGNSSLKERIYINSPTNKIMAGVLIYTAGGESDGSLGGLFSQGKPGKIEDIIYSALEGARWCSSDPVCSEIGPQGSFGANMAACHNCAILPETSCETFNLLLDRVMLIGKHDLPDTGFFNKIF